MGENFVHFDRASTAPHETLKFQELLTGPRHPANSRQNQGNRRPF
jgi:hypothetical protein